MAVTDASTPVTHQGRDEKKNCPDLRNAQGVVFQVQTLGYAACAVLVAGVVLASSLSGMAFVSAGAMTERLTEERLRHQSAETELRAQLSKAETESRMLEYYVLELDGKLMAAGFVPPSRGYTNWQKEHRK